ncbi:MAG: hypothetical protein IKI90_08380 [Treponema sp.]|nr:hypothetical protein [Treponema sp.]MBR6153881.1 hypothetical protein [Treponema sp.]
MKPLQLEFDFGELPASPSYAERKPVPPLPHFDTPKCDNERLLNYQWEYRENGDQNALNSMYALGYKIALKYIKTKERKNRHIAELCRSDKEEKAHNAITYIISRYLKVTDFSIRESFTSYLYYRVLHELYYRRKVDEIVSFVDMEKFYRGKAR